jgi:hypothetical protein
LIYCRHSRLDPVLQINPLNSRPLSLHHFRPSTTACALHLRPRRRRRWNGGPRLKLAVCSKIRLPTACGKYPRHGGLRYNQAAGSRRPQSPTFDARKSVQKKLRDGRVEPQWRSARSNLRIEPLGNVPWRRQPTRH